MKQPIPTTQNDAILMFLCRGNRITALQAVHGFNCLRLSARIKDLRDEGHKINSTTESKGRKRWSVYWMDEASQKRSMKKRGWG